MTETRRQTCTDHCSGCGRHFHSLGAFDAHMGEGGSRQGGMTYELAHAVPPGLAPWTLQGVCELAGNGPHEGVVVYSLKRDLERAAERFR